MHYLIGCIVFQAHVVAAFEQSLASMTSRLQSLTMTAEMKVNVHLQIVDRKSNRTNSL